MEEKQTNMYKEAVDRAIRVGGDYISGTKGDITIEGSFIKDSEVILG